MKTQTVLIVALLCVVVLLLLKRRRSSYTEDLKYCSDKYKNNIDGRVYDEKACDDDSQCKTITKGEIKLCTNK